MDVVEVPEPVPFGDTPEGFLAIMFPGVEGFSLVHDDTEAGAVDMGDGTFAVPTAPEQPSPEPEPVVRPTKAELMAKVQELLAAIADLPEEE